MPVRFTLPLVATACALALAAAPVPAQPSSAADQGPLHLPSPDWRDQVVYFLMIDRFDDGDPRNNDQGAGEYDPADPARYSGGDLAGVARRLDYIAGLGATAVWITPPVANQWWDGEHGYGGYHGYWAEHFGRVDAHYGTLADYQRLSRSLHARSMYLVQDVVVNHTGNFFRCNPGDRALVPARDCRANAHSRPVARPSQWPFSLNDARDPAQRGADVYHWTPDIVDFSDPVQERDWQLAGLDDLNTANPLVRRALRASYGHWIRAVGVDAFRVDTAFHVPPDFFADFLRSDDAAAPGVLHIARATGRERFHVFGEGFGVEAGDDDRQARKLERWVRAADGTPLLPAMINFPLYGTLTEVFARGRPTAAMSHRIRRIMAVHADPHRMPSFVDNHDVDRFLAGGSDTALRQALLALMTLPGIPTIYYGTEQGFGEQRGAMFAAGYGSGGRDRFDADAPLYRFLQRAIALRRAHTLFSRGTPTPLADSAAGPGALVYRVDAATGEGAHDHASPALVAFNTADAPVLVDRIDTGWAAGTRLVPIFGLDEAPVPTATVDAHGRLDLVLPAHAGYVWRVGAPAPGAPVPQPSPLPVRIDALPGTTAPGPLRVTGHARDQEPFLLVQDGALADAVSVTPDARGRFDATIDAGGLLEDATPHRLVAWSPARGTLSTPHSFRVVPSWNLLVDVDDPRGDDRGPTGRYRYPTDPGWQARQLDLRRLRVAGADGALRLDIATAGHSAGWNPPNGFDRVAFTVYIELPDRDGGTDVMPMQNARLPDGMRWHYRVRVGGWSNALHAVAGAGAASEGTPVIPGASVAVDAPHATVSLRIPTRALGDPHTLTGARVFVTTWDYDGGYRTLQQDPGTHAFGGGDGAHDALVMDAIGPVVLP